MQSDGLIYAQEAQAISSFQSRTNPLTPLEDRSGNKAIVFTPLLEIFHHQGLHKILRPCIVVYQAMKVDPIPLQSLTLLTNTDPIQFWDRSMLVRFDAHEAANMASCDHLTCTVMWMSRQRKPTVRDVGSCCPVT